MSDADIQKMMGKNGYKKVDEELTAEVTETTLFYTEAKGKVVPFATKTVDKVLNIETMYVEKEKNLASIKTDHLMTLNRQLTGDYLIEKSVECQTYNYKRNGNMKRDENISNIILGILTIIAVLL